MTLISYPIFFCFRKIVMARTDNDSSLRMVPTLDGIGWVTRGINDKLDRLLSNFFTSDGSQSSLYYRDFHTFQTINADNVNNLEGIRSSMENYLTAYLRKYFDNVSVEIDVVDLEGNELPTNSTDARVGLYLKVDIKDNEDYVSLEKPVLYEGGVFKYTLDKFSGRN